MREREIVSVSDEEARVAEEQARIALERECEADLKFREQWKLPEDYPACPVGMTLLRNFAEAYTDLYDHFVFRNISGHHSLPALGRNPKWIAYRHHWGTCEDCMEV